MNCPDIETLISFAMNPLACEDSDLAMHIHGCAKCRMNLRLVNDSFLAPEWSSPARPVDVGEITHPLQTARMRLVKTLSARSGKLAARREELSINNFVKTLSKDIKTPSGAWLRKGLRVLCDPEIPEHIERATPDSIQRFIANGFSFFKRLPFGTMTTLKVAQSEINRFGPALDRNIASLHGKTIPNLNLPAWVNFIPWPLHLAFGKHTELSVEKDCLAKWMAENSLLPQPDTMSPACWTAVCSANFFRVYEIRTGTMCFRFFAVYVTPISPTTLQSVAVDSTTYAAVKDFIHEWTLHAADGTALAPANFKCYVMGTSGGWGSVQPVLLHDGIDLLCSPNCDVDHAWDVWDVSHHDLAPYRPIFRDFVYSLYPETEEVKLSRVRALIDDGLMEGSLTAAKVAKEAYVPVEVVEHIFDILQGDGHSGYENYLTERGESAIRKVSRTVKPTRLFRKSGNTLWQYAKCGLIVFSFAGEYARQFVASGSMKMGLAAICASVLAITYVQSCFEGFFKRRLEK